MGSWGLEWGRRGGNKCGVNKLLHRDGGSQPTETDILEGLAHFSHQPHASRIVLDPRMKKPEVILAGGLDLPTLCPSYPTLLTSYLNYSTLALAKSLGFTMFVSYCTNVSIYTPSSDGSLS